ncbi:MAG: DEAD/DEAH box helicase [Candidatus Babeliales bacterium]
MISSFKDIALAASLKRALEELGFTTPTEIQAKAIPQLIDAKNIDFHGQAQTGTGKTLAFGLPLLHHIDPTNKQVQALIVAPTRELVVQIAESLQQVAKYSQIKITTIYGGVSMQDQLHVLKNNGVQVVVGTPGRLNDHLRRKTLKLNVLQTIVLDEADIMLDMGFKEEIDEILNNCSKERNIWLFSATVKGGIEDLKNSHMRNPISVRVSKSDVGNKQVKQYYCIVPSRNRLAALSRFIDKSLSFYGLIFCPTKILAGEVAEVLLKRGYKASALHGDMNQASRNRVIKRFKDNQVQILVATDVAARGIDVADLTHVINYCIPEDQESYVHRIGRTGRAGKEGTAITFINPSEISRIKRLQQRFGLDIKPIDVPSIEDIAGVRVQEAAEYVALSSHKDKHSGAYLDTLRGLVTEYEQADLINVVVNSLHDLFFKHIKQETDISFTPASKFSDFGDESESRGRGRRGDRNDRGGERRDRGDRGPSRLADGHEELALNVGSDDKITKTDLVTFLTQNAKVNGQDLGKIKLIKRCSFISVPSPIVNRVIQSLDGKKFGGRQVRVRRTGE